MNVWIQVLIGTLIGLIFGFLTMSATIKQKEKELKSVWSVLADALNERYRTLRKILKIMGEFMEASRAKIEELSSICSAAIDEMTDFEHFPKRLENENLINDKLETLKAEMEQYTDLLLNDKYNELIREISEKEGIVGEAIRTYNAVSMDFKILLETFPFSFVCWILSKNPENYSTFNVMSKEEFSENYIDEDEI